MVTHRSKPLFGLTLAALLLATHAAGQAGTGRSPASQPAAAEAQGDADRENQIDSRIEEMIKQGGGVQRLQLRSGSAVLSVSMASYTSNPKNKILTIKSQRMAALKAATQARQGLVTYFSGMQLEGRAKLIDSMQASESNNASTTKFESSQLEAIKSSGSGLLRGAITYSIHDDPETGKVVIAVLVTAKSLSAGSGSHLATSSADRDDQEAIDRVQREVKIGTLPPIGIRRIRVSSQSCEGFVWIGYGSGIAAPTHPAVAAQTLENAKRTAKKQSEKMLQIALDGESIESQDSSEEQSSSEVKAAQDLANGASEVFAKEVHEESSQQEIKTKFAGRLPPEIEYIYVISDDGNWVNCIALYRQVTHPNPNANANAPASNRGSQQEARPAVPARVDTTVGADSGFCAPSTDPSVVKVQTRGHDAERSKAIKKALVEALEKANGVAIKSSSVVREIYRDAVKDVNGKLDRVVEAENTNREDISTQTNGLIAGFEVLSEIRGADGKFLVELCVRIPVFDASRPRPGRRISVAVLPFTVDRQSYAVAEKPDGLPARQVQDEYIGEICRLLAGNKDVCVIERQHLAELDGELARMRAEVDAGQMEQGELIKFGQKIGVDYLIVGTIGDLEYSESKVYNRVRQAEEPRSLLHIKSSARLVNVATTVQAAADNYEESWDFIALMSLQPQEAAISRWTFAARSAVKNHYKKIEAGLKFAMAASTFRVLKMISDREAVLEYAGPPVPDGTVLTVYKIEETVSQFTGKVHKIESKKGTVKITRSAPDKEQVYVELLDMSQRLELGDECRR